MKYVYLFSCLILGNLLYGQLSFDLHFQSNSALATDRSIDELYAFLEEEFGQAGFTELDDVEVAIEIFPASNFTLDRIEAATDFLSLAYQKVDKLVFFEEKSHLYFEYDTITNWDFIRLVFTHSDEIIPFEKQQFAGIDSSFQQLQQLEIYVLGSTTVELRKGTILEIPSNCFVYENGEAVKGKVLFTAMEVLDMADALQSKLTTNYGDKILESRGMIYMAATDLSGTAVGIRPGKSIEVSIPNPERKAAEDFAIYRGEGGDGLYDWVLNGEVPVPGTFPPSEQVKKYKWEKIPENERQEYRMMKKRIIADWKFRGKTSIRRTLKKHKEAAKRKDQHYRKKGRLRTKSDRDYAKLSNSMILGEAKYKWYSDTTTASRGNSLLSYYRFSAMYLGPYNVDRLDKLTTPRSDILVQNTSGREVKLFFEDYFILLAGERLNDQTRFATIPEQQEVVIISTREISKDEIELGYTFVTTGSGNYEITNYTLYDRENFGAQIESLTGGESTSTIEVSLPVSVDHPVGVQFR